MHKGKTKRATRIGRAMPDTVNVPMTPGEMFTLQSELQVAQAVRAAMEPEDGDILHAVSEEAQAYGAIRDKRVRNLNARLGRAYATYISGKAKSGTAKGRTRSTKSRKSSRKR